MIARETLVEQSVTDYVKEALNERGYPPEDWTLVESFNYVPKDGLDKNYLAAGFNFDDGGEQAELGSDLKVRRYTIEFFVFGVTNTYGRNLASAIALALDRDGLIPLNDYGQTPPAEIDRMQVDKPHARREIIPAPEPWQEFVWSVTVVVEDTYFAALV